MENREEKHSSSMMWMMVACCALPLILLFFAGGFWTSGGNYVLPITAGILLVACILVMRQRHGSAHGEGRSPAADQPKESGPTAHDKDHSCCH